MEYGIVGWSDFQQYKDGRPLQWIKLPVSLLDDYEFNNLSESQQLQLVKIWLFAARTGGVIKGDAKWFAKTLSVKAFNLDLFIEKGFMSANHIEAKTNNDQVYLVKGTESGNLKIGYSGNLSQRLDALRRRHEPIELIASFSGTRTEEKLLLDRFEELSIGNEWFKYSEEIISVFNMSVRTSELSVPREEESREEESREDIAGVKPTAPPCPYGEIINKYHETLPMCPKVVDITDARKRAMKARWSNGMNTLDNWGDYFSDVSKSRFLTGRVDPPPGRKQFVADIDFLIKESTIVKTQEGKYHG